MTVRHLSSGSVYQCTFEEWSTIVSQGNAYKFEVVEKDIPVEVKSIRQMRAEKPHEPKIEIKKKVKNNGSN